MLRFAAWAVTLASGGPGVLDNQLILAGHVYWPLSIGFFVQN